MTTRSFFYTLAWLTRAAFGLFLITNAALAQAPKMALSAPFFHVIVPQSEADLERCAEEGNAACQYSFAGRQPPSGSFPIDQARRKKWLLKAAAQNHSMALCDLASYALVEGLNDRDIVPALRWARKAADVDPVFGKDCLLYICTQGPPVAADGMCGPTYAVVETIGFVGDVPPEKMALKRKRPGVTADVLHHCYGEALFNKKTIVPEFTVEQDAYPAGGPLPPPAERPHHSWLQQCIEKSFNTIRLLEISKPFKIIYRLRFGPGETDMSWYKSRRNR